MEDEVLKIDDTKAVTMHVTIQRRIASQKTWLQIDNGIEITEFEYQGVSGQNQAA